MKTKPKYYPIGTQLPAQKFYPIPLTCTAYWTESDWEKIAIWKTQPDTITNSIGTFHWTGEVDSNGKKLYRLEMTVAQVAEILLND